MGYKCGDRDTCLYGNDCMRNCKSGCWQYEEAYGFCVECGTGLAYGTEAYDWYDEILCPDCLEEKIEDFKFRNRLRTDR